MKIRGRNFKFKQIICLFLYYSFARYLPKSVSFWGIGKQVRYFCVKNIFFKCGKNVNVERGALFGSGLDIIIGDNSSIGINAVVPSNIIIGDNVMMGPNCYVLERNHAFSRIDIPMIEQDYEEKKQTIIGDDVWIGRQVLMTPGRIIKKGTIIAAGTILCKNFDEYSVVGGNPSKLIRNRKNG